VACEDKSARGFIFLIEGPARKTCYSNSRSARSRESTAWSIYRYWGSWAICCLWSGGSAVSSLRDIDQEDSSSGTIDLLLSQVPEIMSQKTRT